MRDKIEALTCWGKDAEDILQDIGLEYSFDIYNKENHCKIVVYVWRGDTILAHEGFDFNSSASKLRAFKDVLLFLAKKAGKLDFVGKTVNADIEGKVYKVKVLGEA